MNCRFTVGLVSAILVVPGAVAGPAERERARSPSAPDCRNIQEVAKEAVAYSLLGAQEVYTTPACFKNEVFRFFRPEKRERHDEFGRPVWSEIKLFNKRTDHYSIETVKIVDRNIDGEAK